MPNWAGRPGEPNLGGKKWPTSGPLLSGGRPWVTPSTIGDGANREFDGAVAACDDVRIVGDHQQRHLALPGDDAPLASGQEARAAQTAQSGALDLLINNAAINLRGIGLGTYERTAMLEAVLNARHDGGFEAGQDLAVGILAVEQQGYFSSSDDGIATTLTFPHKAGEFYATITNGTGYGSREVDRFKDYAARLTLTPLARTSGYWKGLDISPWISIGNRASDYADRDHGTVKRVDEGRRREEERRRPRRAEHHDERGPRDHDRDRVRAQRVGRRDRLGGGRPGRGVDGAQLGHCGAGTSRHGQGQTRIGEHRPTSGMAGTFHQAGGAVRQAGGLRSRGRARRRGGAVMRRLNISCHSGGGRNLST